MKKLFSNILLITTITLLFSCGKSDSSGAENLDMYTKTDSMNDAEIKPQEDSANISINGEEKHALRKIALLIESELRKNKVFYLNLTSNISNDGECDVFKETYRKLELDGAKMAITDVSEYFFFTTKEGKPSIECENRDLDRTTYTRNGIFTLDDLTNEIEAIYLGNKSIYYSIGVSGSSINLKNSTLFGKSVTLELYLTLKKTEKNDKVIFSQVYQDYSFFIFKLNQLKGEDVISKTRYDYIARGSDSEAERKFNLLAHSRGSETEDTSEYISIF